MKLWPAFLDRIYWRWFLRRHPYHGQHMTMRFAWHSVHRDLVDAISFTCEEWTWLEDATP